VANAADDVETFRPYVSQGSSPHSTSASRMKIRHVPTNYACNPKQLVEQLQKLANCLFCTPSSVTLKAVVVANRFFDRIGLMVVDTQHVSGRRVESHKNMFDGILEMNVDRPPRVVGNYVARLLMSR
jgi:hypothetical protein